MDKDITLLKRDYVSLDNGLAQVSIGNLSVNLPDHPFWNKFAQGWEVDTERVYQAVVKPGLTVLDVGAWIGPTVLFALACGAERVIAVEPNPESFKAITKMVELNPQLNPQVTPVNQAVGAEAGIMNMGLVAGDSDTSMFGIQGNELQIQSTTLDGLIHEYNLDQLGLIKIDIEGAEVLLAEQLQNLSQTPGQIIHLSVHVPFFPDHADKRAFAESFQHYTVFDDRGEALTQQMLEKRLLSDQTHPAWGTKHGNFFELLLITATT